MVNGRLNEGSVSPRRPVMWYHGGKWRIAPWIISHFPEHKIYVEPFCGAASVLMRKQRSRSEVINDIDSEIVNVFRVLRDRKKANELCYKIKLTPFSREEFESCHQPCDNDIERARRTIVKCFMGVGMTEKTGFRAKTYNRNVDAPQDFANWPKQIKIFTKRLSGVLIDNIDASRCISLHDSKDTLFYIDPPYLSETRVHKITINMNFHLLINTLSY